jgi:hypothetical protein
MPIFTFCKSRFLSIIIILFLIWSGFCNDIDFSAAEYPLDSLITKQPAPQEIKKIVPTIPCDSITFVCESAFADRIAQTLSACQPFDTNTPILMVEDFSGTTLNLRIAPKNQDFTIPMFSPYDIAQGWNTYVRTFPTEGIALFKGLSGLQSYADNRDAVLSGISVVNQYTVSLRYLRVDSLLPIRLMSERLLPASLNLGAYSIIKYDSLKTILRINTGAASLISNCTQIILNQEKSSNPIAVFLQKNCDAVLCTFSNDIDFAQRIAAKSEGRCAVISEDRYFLAVRSTDKIQRSTLASMLSAVKIRQGIPRFEGSNNSIEPCSADSQDNHDLSPLPLKAPAKPLRILLRGDDTLACSIGDRAVILLRGAGISANAVRANNASNYDRMLYRNEWDVVLGSVALADTSETAMLRIASRWFNDNTNVSIRQCDNYELPLFSVKRYMLSKMNVECGMFPDFFVRKRNSTSTGE